MGDSLVESRMRCDSKRRIKLNATRTDKVAQARIRVPIAQLPRSATRSASSRAVSLNGLNKHSTAPSSSSWGRTVLSVELAEACDVPVRWSCRTGVCHTCMTGLIDGSIIYKPEPLERPAPGNVLVCCSQPNAGVTLDL